MLHWHAWTTEDIGSGFFDDLVEWGFLQKEFESGRFLAMHDLIHDLGQNVLELQHKEQ